MIVGMLRFALSKGIGSVMFGSRVRYLILFAWLLSFTGCRDSDWTAAKIAAAKKLGDMIVAALDRYRMERGRFPDRLEDLVPQYLESLRPVPAGTGKWQYGVTLGGQVYKLGFFGSRPDSYWYDTSKKTWKHYQGS